MARTLPFGYDTLVIPCYIDSGDDPEGFERWKREHPDLFVAGTVEWEPERRRPDGIAKARDRIITFDPSQPFLDVPDTDHLFRNRMRPNEPAQGGGENGLLSPSAAPRGSASRGGRSSRRAPAEPSGPPQKPGSPPALSDPATPQQRRDLRNAMTRDGQTGTGDWQAHHIVPGGEPMSGRRDASDAQQSLRRAGIHLDSAANGVPLSREFHSRLHTRDYYDYIAEQIRNARTREDIEAFLRRFAQRLRDADARWKPGDDMPNWRAGP